MEKPVVLAPNIHSIIRNCKGVKVILDSDLAAIYGVPTFRFNEVVRRNIDKFPSDFLFQLTMGTARRRLISTKARQFRINALLEMNI